MICMFTIGIGLFILFFLTNLAGFEVTDSDALIWVMVVTVAYYISLYASPKYRNVRLVLMTGFLVRVFIMIWDIYGRSIYKLPYVGTDTENFYNAAIRFAQGQSYWQNPAVVVFGTMAKLFGPSRLLLQFVLMLFSVAAGHLTIRMMSLLHVDGRSKRNSMWVMALLPNYALLSSVFLRESLVTLFVTLSLYFFIRWWVGKGELSFWLAIAIAFLGTIFHSGIVGVVVGYAGIRFLYDRRTDTYKLGTRSIVVALIFVILFAFLYNRYSSLFFGKMSRIDELSDIASGYGRGQSSYASIAGNSRNLFNFIIFTPIRIILFLFTPLPFQIRDLSDVIAMVFSAFFYLWVYFFVLKRVRRSTQYRHLLISLLIIAISTAFIFGWGGTNIGTNVRHRDKIMPVYILLLALSLDCPSRITVVI